MTESVATKISRLAWAAGALAPALLMLAGTPAMAADEKLGAIAQVSPPNKITSFDIGFVDSVLGKYFLADRTGNGITVVNTHSRNAAGAPAPSYVTTLCQGKFAGAAPPAQVAGPNGVVVVNHNAVWAGDGIPAAGGASTVKVCSLGGLLLKTIIIPNGTGRADEGCFDPEHQLVMFTNDAETPWPFTSIINVRGYRLTQIQFSDVNMGNAGATAGAEQCQYNLRTHTFWHAIPECSGAGTNHGCVVEISPISKTIIAVYDVPFAGCSKPQGLAIGQAPQVLLGCNASSNMPATYPTTILDDGSTGGPKGGVFNVVEEVAGADEVGYNSSTGHFLMASSGFHGNGNPAGAYNCGAANAPPATANTPGPGLLSVVDTRSLPGGGTDTGTTFVDPPSAINVANCTAGTTWIGAHGGSHSVAVDPGTNLVFVPIASTAVGASNTTGLIANFSGVPVPVPTSTTSLTTLCGAQKDNFGASGSDTSGCILVFQDKTDGDD